MEPYPGPKAGCITHCAGCISSKTCVYSQCEIVLCRMACGQSFHACKRDEHDLLCSNHLTACINVEYGCPVQLLRHELSKHLQTCPASVVLCCLQWSRWVMSETRHHSLQPIPDDEPSSQQLDVILGQRDLRHTDDIYKNELSLRIDKTLPKYLSRRYVIVNFPCDQLFRRDQYASHVKDVHLDIHSGLNGWLERRCPMFQAGCKYSQRRLFPRDSQITFSKHLESFGMTCDNGQVNNNPVNIDHLVNLADLPSELLLYLCGYLDSFSLSHLSMTSTFFRGICATRLHSRGIVSLRWTKHTDQTESFVRWKLTEKVWSFSVGFCPVSRWCHPPDQIPMASHLQHCPFNTRLQHTKPFAVPGYPSPDLAVYARLCASLDASGSQCQEDSEC